MNPINRSKNFYLGTFQVRSYKVHLIFDTKKGVQAIVRNNGRSIRNIELIAPFSDLQVLSPQKLIKLSHSLKNDYHIRITETFQRKLRVELTPKLFGGGAFVSKLSCWEEEEKKIPSENKSNRGENKSNIGEIDLSDESQIDNLSLHTLPPISPGRTDFELIFREQYLKNVSEIKALLETYIPSSGSLKSSFEDSFPLEQAVIQFLQNEQKVLLLLGDSGAGKTTFGKYLVYRLWRDWKRGDPIPLFIPLSAINTFAGRAIEQTFENYGFTQPQIEQLQSENSFVFVLDGYDEIGRNVNLYEDHHLKDWKAKVIISCRSQNLSGDTSTLFAPLDNFVPQGKFLREIWVTPFTENQIDDYIKKYLILYPTSPWSDYKIYKEHFLRIPGLFSLISTPFLLYIAADVLPDIVSYHEQQNSDKYLHLVQCDLYDAFINKWFERAEKKLQDGNKLEGFEGDSRKSFEEFSKKLATKMYEKNTTIVKYVPSEWGQNDNEWEEFFGNKEFLPLIRSGVPIHKVDNNTYAFLHKSILEYFIYRDGLDQVISSDVPLFLGQINMDFEDEKTPLKSINRSVYQDISREKLPKNLTLRLLNDESGVVGFQADRVQKDPSYKKFLFSIVEHSKKDAGLAIASANSMTILNAAGVSFSNLDLQGVQIPGAILSNAIMTNANLSHANLRGVQFDGAILDFSTLISSEAEGLEFGQKTSISSDGGVWSIAISPDGKRIISGNGYGRLRLYDCETAEELLSFEGHFRNNYDPSTVKSVAFSPDGKQILSGSADETVRLWNCETGKEVRCLQAHIPLRAFPRRVNSVSFSPDGKQSLAGSSDGIVRVWDLETGSTLFCFEGHTGEIDSVVFSPDGKRALSGSKDKTIRLWSCETPAELLCFQGHNDRVTSVAFFPDGKRVLSGSWDKTVRIWDVETGKELLCLQGHSDWVHSVAASPNGMQILSGSKDKSVRLWDYETGKELISFQGHTADVHSVAFSSDGKRGISGSGDNHIRIWDLMKIHTAKSKTYHLSSINDIQLSTDGRTVLSCSDDKTVRLWDSETGKELFCLKGHTESVKRIAFSHNSKRALSISKDKTIRFWDCETGLSLFCLEDDGSMASHVVLSADGKRALSGGADKIIRLWDVDTRKELLSLKGHNDKVNSVAFSSDGKRALSGSSDKTIRLWDLETGKELLCLAGHEDKVNSVVLSSDGKRALSGSSDKTISLWDCETGKLVRSFKGLRRPVFNVFFSPDEKRFISWGDGSDGHLWDCETGKDLIRLSDYTSNKNSIDFSKNSKLVLSGMFIPGNIVGLWNCETGRELHNERGGEPQHLHLGYPVASARFLPDEKSVIIATDQPSLQRWQLFDDKDRFRPALIWNRSNGNALSARKLNFYGTKGLSQQNRKLFFQNGAYSVEEKNNR